jgi:hypothetical protein
VSRHVSCTTCPSSGGTSRTQNWWLLCAVVDVGWSQDMGNLPISWDQLHQVGWVITKLCNMFVWAFRKYVLSPPSGWLNFAQVDVEVFERRKFVDYIERNPKYLASNWNNSIPLNTKQHVLTRYRNKPIHCTMERPRNPQFKYFGGFEEVRCFNSKVKSWKVEDIENRDCGPQNCQSYCLRTL